MYWKEKLVSDQLMQHTDSRADHQQNAQLTNSGRVAMYDQSTIA